MSHLPSVPILTCAESRTWERYLLGTDEATIWPVMQRAGRGLAGTIEQSFLELAPWPSQPRILILCGKGHNGGDALLAAHELFDSHPQSHVTVVLTSPVRSLRPLCRKALRVLTADPKRDVTIRVWTNRTESILAGRPFDLGIDGLFGMSFRPPLGEHLQALATWWNDHPALRCRIAIDLPSGVGDASAETIFRADVTIATGIAKAPLFEPSTTIGGGRIRWVDLGFFEREEELDDVLGPRSRSRLLTDRILDEARQIRSSNSEKRAFGHVLIIGGSRAMPGAIRMTVEAALRSGAGLVTAAVPESVAAACAAVLPEAMWVPLPEHESGALHPSGMARLEPLFDRATAVVTGPGMTALEPAQELLQKIVTTWEGPLLLDADALRRDIVALARGRKGPLVLTPHGGEFARLGTPEHFLIGTDEETQSFARQTRATIVLKGPVTRVTDGETLYQMTAGGPIQARGGAGDLLAGIIGTRLAQDPDPLIAAAEGAYWLGRAAELLAAQRGATALRTTNLLDTLPEVLRSV